MGKEIIVRFTPEEQYFLTEIIDLYDHDYCQDPNDLDPNDEDDAKEIKTLAIIASLRKKLEK